MHYIIIAEVIVDKKSFLFSCLHRSRGQTHGEFKEFCNDLNLLLSHVNDVNGTSSVIIKILMPNRLSGVA